MAHLTLTELFPGSFLKDSTEQTHLGEEFHLCENGNMVFNWTDYHATCDAIKTAMDAQPELKEEISKKESNLARMAQIPVWIRTDKKVHQSTMYDLYERYILNTMKFSLGVDPFGPIEISFISSTGPFKELAIAECFNKDIYKDFVMMYLLKGTLPKRDYRIRLKSKVLVEYGENFGKAGLVNLEQLTMNGFLFSIDSDFFLNEVAKVSELRVLLDTTVLAGAAGKNLEEIRAHLSSYAFNLMYSSRKEDSISVPLAELEAQSSFDFLKNKKVYLFVPYHKVVAGKGMDIKSIQQFMAHTRDLIREHYNFDKVSKSA